MASIKVPHFTNHGQSPANHVAMYNQLSDCPGKIKLLKRPSQHSCTSDRLTSKPQQTQPWKLSVAVHSYLLELSISVYSYHVMSTMWFFAVCVEASYYQICTITCTCACMYVYSEVLALKLDINWLTCWDWTYRCTVCWSTVRFWTFILQN